MTVQAPVSARDGEAVGGAVGASVAGADGVTTDGTATTAAVDDGGEWMALDGTAEPHPAVKARPMATIAPGIRAR